MSQTETETEITAAYQRPESNKATNSTGESLSELFAKIYTEPPKYDENFQPLVKLRTLEELREVARLVQQFYLDKYGQRASNGEAVAVMAEEAFLWRFANDPRNNSFSSIIDIGCTHGESPKQHVLDAFAFYNPEQFSASDIGGMPADTLFTKAKPIFYNWILNPVKRKIAEFRANNPSEEYLNIAFFTSPLGEKIDESGENELIVNDGVEKLLKLLSSYEKPNDSEYEAEKLKEYTPEKRAGMLLGWINNNLNHGTWFASLPISLRESSLAGAKDYIRESLKRLALLQNAGATGTIFGGNFDHDISWFEYWFGNVVNGSPSGTLSEEFRVDVPSLIAESGLEFKSNFGHRESPDRLDIYFPFVPLLNYFSQKYLGKSLYPDLDPDIVGDIVSAVEKAKKAGKIIIGHAHAAPVQEIHNQPTNLNNPNTQTGLALLELLGMLKPDYVVCGHMHDPRKYLDNAAFGELDPNSDLVMEFEEGEKFGAATIVTDLNQPQHGHRIVFVYTPLKEAAMTHIRSPLSTKFSEFLHEIEIELTNRKGLPPVVITPNSESGLHPERINTYAYWGVENDGSPIEGEAAFVTDIVSASFNTLAILAQEPPEFYIVGDDEAAKRAITLLQEKHPEKEVVLVGESTDDELTFLCNNNPINVMKADLAGKIVIQKTHNGTATVAETYARMTGEQKRIFSFHWANLEAAVQHIRDLDIHDVSLVASGGREAVFSDHRLLEDWYAVLAFNQLIKGVPVTEERYQKYFQLTKDAIALQYPESVHPTREELDLLFNQEERFNGMLPEYIPVDGQEGLFEVKNALTNPA